MKIGEARAIYREQITAYRDQQQALQKQRQELQEKIDSTPDGKTIYAKEAATLELTYDAVRQKQQEYQDYMAKLLEQKSGYMDMMAAKNEGEAMKEYAEDMAKIMQVARRIMKGGIVPLSDERKLMEFDNDLYQMAKSIGAMVQLRKRKEYDSLWDEEEKEEPVDAQEYADEQQAISGSPEVVSVEETMESAESSI